MLLCKVRRMAGRLLIEDEVDAALAEERNLLGPVPRHGFETERLEDRLQHPGLRCSKFYELESVETHGVVE